MRYKSINNIYTVLLLLLSLSKSRAYARPCLVPAQMCGSFILRTNIAFGLFYSILRPSLMFSDKLIVIASLGDMVISALTYIPELSLRVLGISKICVIVEPGRC